MQHSENYVRVGKHFLIKILANMSSKLVILLIIKYKTCLITLQIKPKNAILLIKNFHKNPIENVYLNL